MLQNVRIEIFKYFKNYFEKGVAYGEMMIYNTPHSQEHLIILN